MEEGRVKVTVKVAVVRVRLKKKTVLQKKRRL